MIHIAVCDDDACFVKEDARQIADILNGAQIPYTLSAFSNGIQLLENGPFDLVFLDVEMPEIYTKFNEIVGDKTAIYISHRLSSCRFCDRIAVFEKGSIVQVARTRSCFVTGVANSMNSGMHKRSITRKRKY